MAKKQSLRSINLTTANDVHLKYDQLEDLSRYLKQCFCDPGPITSVTFGLLICINRISLYFHLKMSQKAMNNAIMRLSDNNGECTLQISFQYFFEYNFYAMY